MAYVANVYQLLLSRIFLIQVPRSGSICSTTKAGVIINELVTGIEGSTEYLMTSNQNAWYQPLYLKRKPERRRRSAPAEPLAQPAASVQEVRRGLAIFRKGNTSYCQGGTNAGLYF